MKIDYKDEEVNDGRTTAAMLYDKYSADRELVLNIGRENAAVTIPAVCPPKSATRNTRLKHPFQAFGARCVNSLTANIVLAMLPPNSSFFKLEVDKFELSRMIQANETKRSDVEKLFSLVESSIMLDINSSTARAKMTDAIKQLIVVGNCLVYIGPKNQLKTYKLNNYVVKRDGLGNVLDIICLDVFDYSSMPDNVREIVKSKRQDLDNKQEVQVYTRIYLSDEGDKYEIYQEVEGEEIPDSRGSYKKDALPWLALRFYHVDGEDYGRSLVEEYYGDFRFHNGMSKALLNGTLASAKVVFLVKPGSITKKATLARSQDGDFVDGVEGDVSVLQLNKSADFSFVQAVLSQVEQRLGQAFMLVSSITRNAERVTAEEIKIMASQLETNLGGIYSMLSQEFQLPLVSIKLAELVRANKFPDIPKELLRPVITTGVEALGRGQDLDKLTSLISIIQPLGEQGLSSLNISEYIGRVAAALSIDVEGLVKSVEEVSAEQQAQLDAQAQAQAAPGIAEQMMAQEQAGVVQ